VAYRRIGQAGLQNTPRFIVAAQLDVEHGFRGEAAIEEIDVSSRDLEEVRPWANDGFRAASSSGGDGMSG
jgi:hypothetical protein